jgi:o-succinylbenzoate synthase
MKIDIEERVLHFKQPAGTSRGVYTERRMWLVRASDGSAVGTGECAPLPQLSCDDIPNYGEVLRGFCDEVERQWNTGGQSLCNPLCCSHEGQSPSGPDLRDYPSMLFGLETALLSLERAIAPETTAEQDSSLFTLHSSLFDTPFSRGEVGIPINGLVWMGTYEEMSRRIEEKLEQGFRCVKLKIGAIDFDAEIALLKQIRQRFGPRDVELRVDANGAFGNEGEGDDDVLYKLELLSQYALHSIEQPIRAGQWGRMAELCRESPLRIALDEELIGVNDPEQKRQLLNIIRPAYIVLKPSLHGGMAGCREWIETARDMGIGSWITSALESNVGLNAIAQFCSAVYGDHITMPQGLGTGQLFTDNIPMPLEIRGDKLWRLRD